MEPQTQPSNPLSDAQLAAEIAFAVEHGDREGLLEALRQHPEAQGLDGDVLEELASVLMEGDG